MSKQRNKTKAKSKTKQQTPQKAKLTNKTPTNNTTWQVCGGGVDIIYLYESYVGPHFSQNAFFTRLWRIRSHSSYSANVKTALWVGFLFVWFVCWWFCFVVSLFIKMTYSLSFLLTSISTSDIRLLEKPIGFMQESIFVWRRITRVYRCAQLYTGSELQISSLMKLLSLTLL